MIEVIPPPQETIWLIYEGNGEWVWCEEPNPTGDFQDGFDSFKYTRAQQQPTDSEMLIEYCASDVFATVNEWPDYRTDAWMKLPTRLRLAINEKAKAIATAMEQSDESL